jgi:hypothetical protein
MVMRSERDRPVCARLRGHATMAAFQDVQFAVTSIGLPEDSCEVDQTRPEPTPSGEAGSGLAEA